MNRHGVIALAIAATAACRAPAAPTIEPVRPTESAAPVRAQETVAPVSTDPSPPPMTPDITARVVNAYHIRARGEPTAAAAAFEALVKDLLAFGKAKAPGLGDANGEVVKGRTHAAFQLRDSWRNGTWFFDIETGEPSAYFPDMRLKNGAAAAAFAPGPGRAARVARLLGGRLSGAGCTLRHALRSICRQPVLSQWRTNSDALGRIE